MRTVERRIDLDHVEAGGVTLQVAGAVPERCGIARRDRPSGATNPYLHPAARRHASVPLEVLHFAFVLFGLPAGLERAEVAALVGFRVELARVQAIFAAGEFADHRDPPAGWQRAHASTPAMKAAARISAVHVSSSCQQFIYFQLRGLPSASHSIACASRFRRVSSRLASVIQSTYSR